MLSIVDQKYKYGDAWGLQQDYSVCGGIQPAQLVCTVVKLI